MSNASISRPVDSAGHTFKGTLQKPDIFQEFVQYSSLPDPEKCDYLGIERDKDGRPKTKPTLKAFALKWGVSEHSLYDWKKRDDFYGAVLVRGREWGVNRIPNALAALYNRVIKYGMAYDFQVYMAYTIGWNMNRPPERRDLPFTMDDIRAIVAVLPKEKQAKFYAAIADIIGDAELTRSSAKVQGDQPELAAAHQGEVRG